MSLKKSCSTLLSYPCLSLSLLFCLDLCSSRRASRASITASWLSLTGEPWFPLFEGSQDLAEYRLAHLGSPRDPPLPLAEPTFIFLHPCDGGPPCRLRDLQLFRIWSDRRRMGPRPGVELALSPFCSWLGTRPLVVALA